MSSESTTTKSAAELYEAIIARIEAGENAHQAAVAVLGPGQPDLRGKRYSCGKCLDTGIVDVWHTLSMRAALEGTLDHPNLRRCMGVACDCRAGDDMSWPDTSQQRKSRWGWCDSARYTPDRYCRVLNGDVDHPDRIAELVEWVQDYRRKSVEPVTSGVFRDWNEGS